MNAINRSPYCLALGGLQGQTITKMDGKKESNFPSGIVVERIVEPTIKHKQHMKVVIFFHEGSSFTKQDQIQIITRFLKKSANETACQNSKHTKDISHIVSCDNTFMLEYKVDPELDECLCFRVVAEGQRELNKTMKEFVESSFGMICFCKTLDRESYKNILKTFESYQSEEHSALIVTEKLVHDINPPKDSMICIASMECKYDIVSEHPFLQFLRYLTRVRSSIYATAEGETEDINKKEQMLKPLISTIKGIFQKPLF